MFYRKLTTTFVSSVVVAIMFSFILSLGQVADLYEPSRDFIFMTLFIFLWTVAIILVFGNIASFSMNWLHQKFFPTKEWLYLLILVSLGALFGAMFQSVHLALVGCFGALVYVFLEMWIFKMQTTGKKITIAFLIPIFLFVACWVILAFISPPLPPFTAEEAVEFATSGDGTVLNEFPTKVGSWKIEEAGYQVTRETKVSEVDKGMYIVSFVTKWEDGETSDFSEESYLVKRGSMTFYKDNGKILPFAK